MERSCFQWLNSMPKALQRPDTGQKPLLPTATSPSISPVATAQVFKYMWAQSPPSTASARQSIPPRLASTSRTTVTSATDHNRGRGDGCRLPRQRQRPPPQLHSLFPPFTASHSAQLKARVLVTSIKRCAAGTTKQANFITRNAAPLQYTLPSSTARELNTSANGTTVHNAEALFTGSKDRNQSA